MVAVAIASSRDCQEGVDQSVVVKIVTEFWVYPMCENCAAELF